jgi:small subunit ribosomal protein S9
VPNTPVAYRGTGKRKTSVARVVLVPGSGQVTVNGKALAEYFPRPTLQSVATAPLRVSGTDASFDVRARIDGGGISGQAGALRLGIARSLNEIDVDNNRATLKKAGYLRRDARIIERKKAGLKKARKAQQYSKR